MPGGSCCTFGENPKEDSYEVVQVELPQPRWVPKDLVKKGEVSRENGESGCSSE